MSGIKFIQKLQRMTAILDKMGFCITSSRFGGQYHVKDVVALVPKDQDSLPLYNRDAEVFVGTLEEVENWIIGVQWARDYDCMLFGDKHDNKRQRKEQDYINKKLVEILKKDHDEQSNG